MKGVEQELKQELMNESAKENLARNEMIRREDSKKICGEPLDPFYARIHRCEGTD